MSTCAHGKSPASDSQQKEDLLIEKSLSRIKHKLLVMSGKGGVGKSSIAANLAAGLSLKGYEVGLMDVDLHGPSIPRMLGLTTLAPVRPEQEAIYPLPFRDHLKVISIESLMPDKDSPVIWRGPLKIGVIRQFIADVVWGHLDFLVIDSPPGTGDEPLTVAQTIPDAQAVIVTTPQDISLADVRKSINFCHQVNMKILGLVENMSGYNCPHCGQELDLFKKGGGRQTALDMGVPFLGSIPIDRQLMEMSDRGQAYLLQDLNPMVRESFEAVLANILNQLIIKGSGATAPVQKKEGPAMTPEAITLSDLKIAIPLAEGVLCNHFGHCEQFALIDLKGSEIAAKQMVTPPPHEPGLLPRWLGEKGVNLIIAGGMGQRALSLFSENGIKVLTGAPQLPPEELIGHYVNQTLVTGANVCDH
jgi:Mrp family chromosome partitioning ATPase/predicted Fe-Mo cluster-binding NifX family protein